ncbi:MAG: SpoIIE family protein phosphatase [Bacteroidia bacterium]|nr:SpoIIE family protein phosphatase [Bacteroidia bacterium]
MKTKSVFAVNMLSHPRMICLIVNRWGQLEFASKGLLQFLGKSITELEGDAWIKLIKNPFQRAEIKNNLYTKLLCSDGEGLYFETELLLTPGNTKYMRWDVSLLEDGMVLCLGQDITDIKKSERLIKQQVEALNEKNKNIFESIRYAERLQGQILQSEENIRFINPESFVFYKPKDILSGDYYRVEQKGDTDILVVADCTGHGIPGSMMSFLAHSFFHEAFGKLPDNPSDLLFDAENYFYRALNSFHDETCMDGMDVAVAFIDRKRRRLKFSGASRYGLLFCREKTILLQGSKFSVGFSGYQKDYFNLEYDINKGDMLYLFTDGYADQFGGPNNKKLNRKNFLEILKEAKNFSAVEQHSFLEYSLNNWMQNAEQTDDITVLGYRIG